MDKQIGRKPDRWMDRQEGR
ncbi:hypothetical protein BIW11_04961 [Tropilaelaps mercedesae]|uniref:Uncharacterized protein n=1 Tax=Tropilaelaps mercedesae TaxID=418985 RepID=A0A1V9WZK7_9ACAR|nr:hypothetical protein BIW11_04961 [Tropilaelaps mercedesae]